MAPFAGRQAFEAGSAGLLSGGTRLAIPFLRILSTGIFTLPYDASMTREHVITSDPACATLHEFQEVSRCAPTS